MGFEVLGTSFQVPSNYSFVKALGKGAYGIVCCARDEKLGGKRVAIKKIYPMSKTVYDAKHTLREIRLLRHCGQHPNIISLLNLVANVARDELYIVMECMDTDLHRIIQSRQQLSPSHHRHFMHQLVQGIEFLHGHGVLHRDLKPANLLVKKNCELRISDFGLARQRPDASDDKHLMTEHVVTRWYRPPELMLSPDGKYTAAVDMWSIGCIFAELLMRKPLFPGKNFVHQLQLIFDVIGTPCASETGYIKNSQALQFLKSLQMKAPIDMSQLFPAVQPEAVDFVRRCMRFSTEDRMRIEEAIEHPLFSACRKVPTEQISLDPSLLNFDFEQKKLDQNQLKTIILEEVKLFSAQLQRPGRKLRRRSSSSCAGGEENEETLVSMMNSIRAQSSKKPTFSSNRGQSKRSQHHVAREAEVPIEEVENTRRINTRTFSRTGRLPLVKEPYKRSDTDSDSRTVRKAEAKYSTLLRTNQAVPSNSSSASSQLSLSSTSTAASNPKGVAAGTRRISSKKLTVPKPFKLSYLQQPKQYSSHGRHH